MVCAISYRAGIVCAICRSFWNICAIWRSCWNCLSNLTILQDCSPRRTLNRGPMSWLCYCRTLRLHSTFSWASCVSEECLVTWSTWWFLSIFLLCLCLWLTCSGSYLSIYLSISIYRPFLLLPLTYLFWFLLILLLFLPFALISVCNLFLLLRAQWC